MGLQTTAFADGKICLTSDLCSLIKSSKIIQTTSKVYQLQGGQPTLKTSVSKNGQKCTQLFWKQSSAHLHNQGYLCLQIPRLTTVDLDAATGGMGNNFHDRVTLLIHHLNAKLALFGANDHNSANISTDPMEIAIRDLGETPTISETG